MDRRVALKNLGLTFGYVVATPTLISIVQSCKNQEIANWTPEIFTKEQGNILAQLADIIIPKTDSPSATEVKVHVFIDKYMSVANTKEQQDLFKLKMSKFTDLALKTVNKEKIADLSNKDLETTLASSLKQSEEQEAINTEKMKSYMQAIADEKPAAMDTVAGAASFAIELRGRTISGYKSTEEIAKNYLAFDPIPGKYIACGTVEELTSGKAWYI